MYRMSSRVSGRTCTPRRGDRHEALRLQLEEGVAQRGAGHAEPGFESDEVEEVFGPELAAVQEAAQVVVHLLTQRFQDERAGRSTRRHGIDISDF
jgi:hypothetical protein